MKLLDLEIRRSDPNIVCLGDIHVGAMACDKKKFVKAVYDIRHDKRANVFLMGDQLDAIIHADKRYSVYELDTELPSFQDQVNWLRHALKPIKKQIVGIIEGNHEEKLKKRIGYDFTEWLAEDLNTTYLGQNAIVNIDAGGHDYRFMLSHGIGGAQTIGSQLLKIKKMIMNFEKGPDVFVVGHWHRLDNLVVPVLKDNLEVKTRNIGFSGTFFRTYGPGLENYANQHWYRPSLIGYLKYSLNRGNINGKTIIL